jgi:SAM-dependent methyltransferase
VAQRPRSVSAEIPVVIDAGEDAEDIPTLPFVNSAGDARPWNAAARSGLVRQDLGEGDDDDTLVRADRRAREAERAKTAPAAGGALSGGQTKTIPDVSQCPEVSEPVRARGLETTLPGDEIIAEENLIPLDARDRSANKPASSPAAEPGSQVATNAGQAQSALPKPAAGRAAAAGDQPEFVATSALGTSTAGDQGGGVKTNRVAILLTALRTPSGRHRAVEKGDFIGETPPGSDPVAGFGPTTDDQARSRVVARSLAQALPQSSVPAAGDGEIVGATSAVSFASDYHAGVEVEIDLDVDVDDHDAMVARPIADETARERATIPPPIPAPEAVTDEHHHLDAGALLSSAGLRAHDLVAVEAAGAEDISGSDADHQSNDSLTDTIDDSVATEARERPRAVYRVAIEQEGGDDDGVLTSAPSEEQIARQLGSALSVSTQPLRPERSDGGRRSTPRPLGDDVAAPTGSTVSPIADPRPLLPAVERRGPVALQPVSSASVGDLQSKASGVAAAAIRTLPREAKRAKAWYEEVFDENYLKTIGYLTPACVTRQVNLVEESAQLGARAKILDLGCGSGLHAIEFAKRGYQVTGFDLSLPLLLRAAESAERLGLNLELIHGDYLDLNFDRHFDAVCCLGTSFGYMDDEGNRAVISAVHRALRDGGRFVIEVINRDNNSIALPARNWWEGDGCVVVEEVDLDFFTSRIVTKRSLLLDGGAHVEQEMSVRVYSLHELGKLLHRSGFRVQDVSGHAAYPGRFLGVDSPDLIFVAEKRANPAPG